MTSKRQGAATIRPGGNLDQALRRTRCRDRGRRRSAVVAAANLTPMPFHRAKSRRGFEGLPFWASALAARCRLCPELRKSVGNLEPRGFDIDKDVRARAEAGVII